MADSSFGQNPIVIDLTSVGARVIWPAPNRIKIRSIEITGFHAATDGNIVIRQDSASGTQTWAYKNIDTTGAAVAVALTGLFFDYAQQRAPQNGLYMDAIANAWGAGSNLIIWYD